MSETVETNLLGCILLDYKRCLPMASSIIKSADFKDLRNASIFETMLKLELEGKGIDSVTVYESLKLNNYQIKVSELEAMTDNVIMAHTDTYAEQIKDLSRKRQLYLKINDIKERLTQGESFESVISDLMGKISELEADKISEFINAKDVINEVYNEVKEGKHNGIMTGYEKLDKTLRGFQKGNLIVIGADTGKGKTAFALNVAANILSNFKTVILYSLEMSASENIKRMLSIISHTNSNTADVHLTPEEVKRRLEGCGDISTFNLIVNDRQQSVNSIRATAKAKANELLREHKHIDLIIVDYVQIMTTGGKSDNRQEEISGIAQNLKTLAKELNVPVLVLSQVNSNYQKEKRDHRLSDVRESTAITHAADVVMFLNKDNEKEVFDPMFTVSVMKNRHGPLCFMKCEFIREYTIFKEVTE